MPQLDGVRGIAACVIAFLFHTKLFFAAGANPLGDVAGVGWLVRNGWMFVDLFFVLSGFVFAHCYLVEGRMRDGVTSRTFTIARIARLWPLHLAMLAAAVLTTLTSPLTTAGNIALSASGLHVLISSPTDALNGPAWSLSVELICYLVFLIASLMGRRAFIAIAILCIGIGTAQILTNGVWGALIGRGLLGFFAGCLLRRGVHHLARIPAFVLIPLLAIPVAIEPSPIRLVLTTTLAFPSAILLALRWHALASAPMRWLGDRSYAIYLSHIPIYMIVGKAMLLLGISAPWALMGGVVLTWPVILFFSNVLYLRLERPWQKRILEWDAARRLRTRHA